MTRNEARELRKALDDAMFEVEAETDLRDVPDALIEAMGLARGIAVKYAERENLSISFDGEASESFANLIGEYAGHTVCITGLEGGEPFDAILLRSGINDPIEGETWYDAVTVARADEDSAAIPGTEQTIRVSDVLIY